MSITRQAIIDIFTAIKTAVEGAIPAGTNLIGKVSIDQVTADANKVVTTTGSITTATLGAGTAIAGKVGIDQTTDGTTNKVYVGNTANVQLTGSSLAVANVQNVTTAGTRVQLSSVACREITIIAKRANTGYIYVGGVTVSSTVYGAELEAKDSITIPVSNADEIYIDSSVSGEGISYVAV